MCMYIIIIVLINVNFTVQLLTFDQLNNLNKSDILHHTNICHIQQPRNLDILQTIRTSLSRRTFSMTNITLV